MKKLIALVVILALPAMAFGETEIVVTSTASSTLTYVIGTAPLTIPLELTLTTEQMGIFGVGGSLSGPPGLSATWRAFTAPVSTWVANDANYIVDPLPGIKDWGAIEQAGNNLNLLNSPGGEIEKMTISGVSGLGVGVYTITVGDVPGMEVAGVGWWSNTGEPLPFDSVEPLTITIKDIPEPATMLLMAAAVPFLRRRTA